MSRIVDSQLFELLDVNCFNYENKFQGRYWPVVQMTFTLFCGTGYAIAALSSMTVAIAAMSFRSVVHCESSIFFFYAVHCICVVESHSGLLFIVRAQLTSCETRYKIICAHSNLRAKINKLKSVARRKLFSLVLACLFCFVLIYNI